MAIDLTKLVSQGRAYSVARPWTPEELDALLLLERERGIGRLLAADFIRNGVTTLEAYDKAIAAEFKPKTLEQAAVDAEAVLKDNDFAVSEPKEEAEASPEVESKPKKGKK